MKGLDTNVLVRYLTADDPGQARKASRYIEETIAAGEACFVNVVVLCETVWVLESAFGYSKELLVEALEAIVAASGLELEHKDAVWAAVEDYRRGKADFSDYVIGRVNRLAGCAETGSFDSALRGMAGFRLL